MNENNKNANATGTSKLALLRQNRSIKKQEVDIEKAMDGFVSSLDTKTMMQEIKRNSASVNLMVDSSSSMYGTADQIAQEINEFAQRQASKIYTTKLSLTVFNNRVYTIFRNQDTKAFIPISPWDCVGGTNIHDAIFHAIPPIQEEGTNHKLHLLITDGENGWSEHTQEQVQELMANRLKNEHVFLLYNDKNEYRKDSAKDYAMKLGINPNNAVNFNRNGDGIKIIFQTIEALLDGIRTNGIVPTDWAKAITAHAANPMGIKANEIRYLT